jgi:UDP-glucose 4-epimerase
MQALYFMVNKKKILITGGCGYIGSHTILDLIENGFEIVSIDNFSNSFIDVLEGIKASSGITIKNYIIDLCDLQATEAVFQKEQNIKGVIHFAAKKYVNESVIEPLTYYHNNLASLNSILFCCNKYQIENFVFSSSCSVYGNVSQSPVDEDCPLAIPESPYANTKVIGEQIIRDFVKVSQIKVSLLRYFNPAGAHKSGFIGERPNQEALNIVPRITATALGAYQNFGIAGNDYPTKDGTCVRDYIHVSDIAHAHTLALSWLEQQENTSICEVFNLGSGNGVSVLEMVKAFEKVSKQKLNYTFEARRAGDVVSIYANNTKAKTVLNWQPNHSLEDMMLSAWKWDKANF